ncbi:transcriptional regulator [Curtobacterium sp. MCBD17_013]|uniref:helix-turn-helix transcriptional regulator n=1 Tax=unclassified Curtobacterium TaxID=257496 RepID=UPI000DA9B872|nr:MULTISPECIES: helix-turn-helix transcriptional regulator [unclassified Curtobacterium]PZF60516.1 transcriptional regulator [Curtobacterium sp. MCBD17_013]WIB65196.1 helix-turn-helix transcriptional regulator [Curtobacterium sp. MCBD17_040]WIB69071.1 helix-turn-helix transcriptional regulator [Curtobacterium sp. MCBD17_035]
MDRDGLADFLRRRRERIQPEDVGLGAGPRRRTPGLRRDDVAALAGMSTDYYTRLEQQRGPQPSEQMLQALARALRLTVAERDHLFHLAGHNAPVRVRRADHVAPPLLRVLDRLDADPAIVVSDLGETLAENRRAVALLGATVGLPGPERYQVWRWFLGRERERYAPEEHERQARIQVASLRAAVGAAGPGDRRARELVAGLTARSPEFVAVWERHEVAERFTDHKTFLHPELGRLEVDCQVLLTENRAQALLVFTAEPGTEAADRLALLGVLGEQRFGPTPSEGTETSARTATGQSAPPRLPSVTTGVARAGDRA